MKLNTIFFKLSYLAKGYAQVINGLVVWRQDWNRFQVEKYGIRTKRETWLILANQ